MAFRAWINSLLDTKNAPSGGGVLVDFDSGQVVPGLIHFDETWRTRKVPKEVNAMPDNVIQAGCLCIN